MLERIIGFSLEQRWLVLACAVGLAGLGIYNYGRLPIDAVPDITNVQVMINTEGFVPRDKIDSHKLGEGDAITFVLLVGGG